LFVVVTAQRAIGELRTETENIEPKTKRGAEVFNSARYYSLLNCQFGLTHAKRHENATDWSKCAKWQKLANWPTGQLANWATGQLANPNPNQTQLN